ncbi:hypothetical protein EB796_019399 [Bugula neritina]|uniref:Secreted protein n=1 Tax=Bugula neritina TaxID=10212 RepID=A0A7J7J7S7_BUGNE|nr:hypothetical protein EB796_019399 [Bugula neritina]
MLCSCWLAATLNGLTSAVTMTINPSLLPTMLQGSLSLRTRAIEGVVLHAHYPLSSSVTISLVNGGQLQLHIQTAETGKHIF